MEGTWQTDEMHDIGLRDMENAQGQQKDVPSAGDVLLGFVDDIKKIMRKFYGEYPIYARTASISNMDKKFVRDNIVWIFLNAYDPQNGINIIEELPPYKRSILFEDILRERIIGNTDKKYKELFLGTTLKGDSKKRKRSSTSKTRSQGGKRKNCKSRSRKMRR